MAESNHAEFWDWRKQIDEDIIPPTGRFALDISIDDDDVGLFITPNHLNDTPDQEEGGDIFDLLASVSPYDLDSNGHQTGQGVSKYGTSTPKGKPSSLGNISAGIVDETIGDDTLRNFADNLSLSSDEDILPSLASRIPKKSTIARLKGRWSVANPQGKAEEEKQSGLNESVCPNSPLPTKEITRKNKPQKDKNKPQNDRFVHASDKDIDDLQYESKAKRTHVQTKWGITTLQGNSIL